MKPRDVADAMIDFVSDHPRLRKRAEDRVARIEAALDRRTNEAKLRRLMTMTYVYSMNRLRRKLLQE